MKKKILLAIAMIAMLACIFAISVSAATYTYYKDEVKEGNELYTITTALEGRGRYELIKTAEGIGFAKTDEEGNPLTWYVVSMEGNANEKENKADGAMTVVVKSAKTLGEAGSVDANGKYTYNTGYDAKKIVSANFTNEMGIKTLGFTYLSTASSTLHPSEYCEITDGTPLLFLYLPSTLTAVPNDLCQRTPVIVCEFENNAISCTSLGGAFKHTANLKSIRIPEGITSVGAQSFRENCSLEYVEFPSTMTTLVDNVFFRSNSIKTVVFGENMTSIGCYDTDKMTMLVSGKQSVNIKYFYLPNTITASGQFDAYRGTDGSAINSVPQRSVVFFVVGSMEDAKNIAKYAQGDPSNKHYAQTIYTNGVVSEENFIENNEFFISYTTYLANKDYYDNISDVTQNVVVYDVSWCEVYGDGVHDLKQVNTFTDALSSFEIGSKCTRCSYTENTVTYAPILEFLGYSAQIGGDLVTVGYKVNQATLEVCPDIIYGILAVVPGENADMSAYEPLNPDLTSAVGDKIITSVVDKKYSDFNLIISNFSNNSAYYEIPIVMCAYVANGEKVDYICHNADNEVVLQEYASAVTFKFIAEECAIKYKVNYTCDSTMGTLTGETSQVVYEGNKSSAVTAVANDGYTFVCWSDGSTDATIEVTPESDLELVAYFTPVSTGLPVMTIYTESGADIVSKDDYINCEITLLDTETGNSIGGKTAEIKGRGNSTWDKFDKKPYKFKFEDKQNLFGYGKEKTWVLLADARDYSLVRNMLALNAGLSMSELGYTSMGQSVELYLNGEYRGVYYLCEQIQVKENRVNITQEDEELVQGPADIGYLIEMDGWVADQYNGAGNVPTMGITPDGDIFVRVDDGLKNGYVIKDPEDILYDANGELRTEYLEYIQGYLVDSLAAIKNASGEYTYEDVCALVDVKSFAQAYIIYEWFKNPDTNYSSVYFHKDKDGKLVASPLWDFDMAVGNVSHKGGGVFANTSTLWTAEKNPWFSGLLKYDEFKALVGQELADNAATLRASVANSLAYARTHADAYKKNFTVWNEILGNTSASDAAGAWSVPTYLRELETWEEHLAYIETYLEASLTHLINTYPAPSAE